jgi:hypothetical protein
MNINHNLGNLTYVAIYLIWYIKLSIFSLYIKQPSKSKIYLIASNSLFFFFISTQYNFDSLKENLIKCRIENYIYQYDI